MDRATHSEDAIERVSAELAAWVGDLGRILQIVDAVLGECRLPAETPEPLKVAAAQVRPLIRECRAGLPTPDVLRAWVAHIATTKT